MLDQLEQGQGENSSALLNNAVGKFRDLFIKSATGVFGKNEKSKSVGNTKFPKWFDKKGLKVVKDFIENVTCIVL